MESTRRETAASISSSESVLRTLVWLLVAISFLYIGLFLVAASFRASYPLQLEALEGTVLDTVGRVLHHQAIYVPPTHRFVPFLYTPLYFYVGALACRVGGFGFSSLRWLSTICTVVCFWVQFRMASRLTQSWRAGVLASGFFAALFATTGWWFDLARVDMLFTALVVSAIYLSWRGHAVWAGLLFAMSYQSKQTGALIGLCVLAHEFRVPSRLLRGLLSFIGFAGGSVLVLSHVYGSWYLYYTRYLPSRHPLELSKGSYYFFIRDLLYPSAIGLTLVALCGMWALQRRRDEEKLAVDADRDGSVYSYNFRFVVATTLGLTAACFMSRIHSGSSVNVTLPLDAWLAVLFGASVLTMFRWTRSSSILSRYSLPLLAAALLQLASLARSPFSYIPSAAAKNEAAIELDRIARMPGDVYVFDGAVDVATVGKQSFAGGIAVWDVLRGDRGAIGESLRNDIAASIRGRQFAAIVSTDPINTPPLVLGAPEDLGLFYNIQSPMHLGPTPGKDAFTVNATHPFPRDWSESR